MGRRARIGPDHWVATNIRVSLFLLSPLRYITPFPVANSLQLLPSPSHDFTQKCARHHDLHVATQFGGGFVLHTQVAACRKTSRGQRGKAVPAKSTFASVRARIFLSESAILFSEDFAFGFF